MADNEKRKLIIKDLPIELSDDDKKDLLKLFGASEVICFAQKGKLRNAVFASFPNAEVSKLALKRLHQMEILGCQLRVEYANDASELFANTYKSRKTLNKRSNLGISKNAKGSNDSLKDEEKEENEDMCDAISSKLGVHHSFPKHLSYLYPAPSVTILTNIANALATVPKFYIQVLHLMNKMNLPPPFTGPTITPPLPDDTIQLRDASVDTNDLQNYESSEESEFESEPENCFDNKQVKESAHKKLEIGRKRKRMKPTNSIALNQNKKNRKLQQQDVEEAFANTQQVKLKRIEFKLAKNIASSLAITCSAKSNDPTTTESMNDINNASHKGFGKLNPNKEDSILSEEEDLHENDFISSREINSKKMSADDLNALPQMKNYLKGSPADRLYIKNLAKQTSKEDLEFIFKRFIRKCDESERERFDIRLMKEGRMKGQAFVTFPSVLQARNALENLHGFILHDKPIIIQFGRTT